MQPLAEVRDLVAARAAELQQSYLAASETARRHDAVGDHLMASVQWRRAHAEQVRLEEVERLYAQVTELVLRDRAITPEPSAPVRFPTQRDLVWAS